MLPKDITDHLATFERDIKPKLAKADAGETGYDDYDEEYDVWLEDLHEMCRQHVTGQCKHRLTGEVRRCHLIGVDEWQRNVYQRVDGWDPCFPHAVNEDGNWIEH